MITLNHSRKKDIPLILSKKDKTVILFKSDAPKDMALAMYEFMDEEEHAAFNAELEKIRKEG